MKGRGDKFAVLALCAFMFSLEIFSIWDKSLTADEGAHAHYGLNILRGDSSRFDDSKMPVTALNALPVVAAQFLKGLLGDRMPPVLSYYGFARIPTMIFSVGLLLAVHCWARRLYGRRPAMLAAFLFALCPNILAHSRLMTNDIYATGGVLLSMMSLDFYVRRRSLPRLLVLSASVAFAAVSKFTCVFLYPLLLLVLVLRYARPCARIFSRSLPLSPAKFARWAFLHLAIFAASNLLLVNSAYFFNGSFRAMKSCQFRSAEFKAMAKVPIFSSLPLPLPAPMVEGLDWVRHNERTGGTFGNIYMLGRTAPKGEGFKLYYLVTWLFKVPIPLQILFYLSLWLYAMEKRRRVPSILLDRDFQLLLLPAGFFLLLLSLVLDAQLGVRYLLVCMPLVIIFAAGRSFAFLSVTKAGGLLLGAACLWIFCSTISYYPHFLSYFNELSPDRKNNWRILADSNLDWGQNQKYLVEYAKANPDIIYNPELECKGHIVVEANRLAGITCPPEKYAWLRRQRTAGHIAYCYIVFHVE